ncbi:hypothetical protein J4Q44_G00321970 [Coregonus suidteri]|uniref:Uncharacterized protein n=1 Tax=Coregonus suidteri TaxID=861788 RepID=A0AAN8KYI3_9TELE
MPLQASFFTSDLIRSRRNQFTPRYEFHPLKLLHAELNWSSAVLSFPVCCPLLPVQSPSIFLRLENMLYSPGW